MNEEALTVAGPLGVLRGIRHRPDRAEPTGTAILLQGYYSSTHVGPARLYVQMARRLAERGFEVWRMDPYGVGDSDGEFEEASYASQLEDYRALLGAARAEAPSRRLLLVGHSMGVSLALRLAAETAEVRGLLLVSPSCGLPSHRENLFSPREWAELMERGETLRKSVLVRRTFLEAIETDEIYEVARRVTVPAVVFHGAEDEFYDRETLARLLAVLPQARLVSIPGADHNYLRDGARGAFLTAFAIALGTPADFLASA